MPATPPPALIALTFDLGFLPSAPQPHRAGAIPHHDRAPTRRSQTTDHGAENSPSPERERAGVRAGVLPGSRRTTRLNFGCQNRDRFNTLELGRGRTPPRFQPTARYFCDGHIHYSFTLSILSIWLPIPFWIFRGFSYARRRRIECRAELCPVSQSFLPSVVLFMSPIKRLDKLRAEKWPAERWRGKLRNILRHYKFATSDLRNEFAPISADRCPRISALCRTASPSRIRDGLGAGRSLALRVALSPCLPRRRRCGCGPPSVAEPLRRTGAKPCRHFSGSEFFVSLCSTALLKFLHIRRPEPSRPQIRVNLHAARGRRSHLELKPNLKIHPHNEYSQEHNELIEEAHRFI